jgi:hypothetical protein
VLKYEIMSPRLRKLNRLISNELNHTDSFPGYKPHVTIGHLKIDTAKLYQSGMNRFSGREFTCDSIVFHSKDRKRYLIQL